MKEEMEETLSARPVATQLRPLNTTQPGPVDDESPALLTWTSSLDFSYGNYAAVRAFVELVSRISAVEPGEALCIQDTAGGGYIEAPVDGNGIATGTWKFVRHQQDAAGGVPTDFSIGPGKTLQLHANSGGKVQLVARASIVPQPALQALGEALQDILLHQHGTEKQENREIEEIEEIEEIKGNNEDGNSATTIITTTTINRWTSASVLNWPPQQKPVELWPGDNTFNSDEPALLHSWFEQRTSDSADLVALDFLSDIATGERTQFTYRQVSNGSNALAVELNRLASTSPAPAGAVHTVAVAMGPCPELYLSYLAALKAGLAFCPIPVDAPRERQAALLADLQPVVVLTHEETPVGLGHITQPTLNTSLFLANCDAEVEPQPRARPIPDTNPAYILYTSGTTGLPKGVIVSHRSAACTVSALSQHYGFSASREQRLRWFQGAAPTFDISIFEIFWTLSTGSTLCCAPRHLTMQDIDSVLSALQADITNVTPSFASLISPSVLPGLMVGGETLNARLLQDFAANVEIQEDGRPRGIYNGYGPTEVAMYSLAQPHVPANQRGSIIGTPLATCGALIVDIQPGGLHPVPQGAIGELILLGPQVSIAGYLNRPEETVKAFIDHEHWGRAYRTGDRARIVWDGNGEPVVEFLGRLSDAQVKLSGRRVELGEIENVLASKTRGVQQTLACVWKPEAALSSGLGSERVISLVVVDPKSGLDFAAVSADCAEAARRFLPDYMRPFRILQVDELPRSASGKANRKAAAEYVHKILQGEASQDVDRESEPAPALDNAEDAHIESELVRILSSIVSETDSVPKLTATTNLAAAGVDSLRAMRLLREIRKQQIGSEKQPLQPSLTMLLDPEATVRSVFFSGAATSATENQAAACKRIDEFAVRHSAASLERLPGTLSHDDVEMVLPMTSTASQLAVSFAMDSNNYVSNSVLPLKAEVSIDALESAVSAVFSRLAVYRSAIVPCSDDMSPFAQVVLTPSAWKTWTAGRSRIVRSRGSTSPEDRQMWLDAAQQNLDFDSNQLYHVQLIESDADGTGLLTISIAHCLCDGASVELLLADIAREYAGLEPLSRLSVRDSVLDWAANVNGETDCHWQKSLKEWEADSFHALSGDNVKSGGDHNNGHALTLFPSSLSWSALEEKSRALGASPLSVLQAAWSLLLKVWSEANTEDIVFGSVLSGQHEACHAPTFSVVPCRVPLPDQQTVGSLLSTLVESGRFTQGHRHTSFGLFGSLPYNTALALQAYGTEVEANVPWTAVELPAICYDFDVFAEVLPHVYGKELLFKVTYRADALSETSAQVVARQFAALTETVLSASSRDLSQGLLSHLPRDLLSVEGTIPVPSVDQEQQQRERVDVLHAQFEKQAAATPDKLALSFYASLDAPPTNLTYAELDARANGLAHILRLEDADVIPICMHRSVDLYVSILAILKAGSAWSPIDETSPVQRRTSLIARTQGKVLLTTTDSYTLVEPCLAHENLAGVRVVFVDKYADQSTTERPNPRDGVTSPSIAAITGQDLAYLLWTSGTTGEPKGVMIQHFAAANAMRDLQVRVEHDPAAGQVRTLQLSAYSFDVFVQDLFFTWGLAGSVISGTRELVLGTFTDFVKTSRPTHAHLTPSFGASIDVHELAGSTLRFVTFIGEKLTEDVAEAWAQPEITTKAYNTYGPAENAVVSTMRQFFGKSRDRAKAANVGFPLTPCTAYVVREVLVSADNDNTDENAAKRWELVPRYGVGELALGGAQVGKGYLNNVAKTTKAFIQGDPASIGERIYLTGDMVRLNDHGFEFLGRNDDLVKITGIRIELSEISAACALVKENEPTIEHVETLYLPRPGGDANHKVIATFVSVKGISPDDVDTAAIRQRVFQKARDVLPAYMVPGHVVVLDTTMPRTASNKVDRKALRAIYSSADLNVLAGQSGGNGAHDAAAKVQWREEQLPVVQAVIDNLASSPDAANPFSPEDSLAGRGFSSLQITKLAWALRKQLGCSVRVLDLMRCQTVGQLVDVVVAALKTAEAERQEQDQTASKPTTSTTATPVPTSWVSDLKDNLTQGLVGADRPSTTDYILPATPVQEALLVETMVEPGAYWSHRLFDLAGFGAVDTNRLRAAWEAAATRLDILRTVFVPLSQLSPKTMRGVSVNTAEWARAHGVHAAVLQLVLQDASVEWTELDADHATPEGLAAHAQKTQSALLPLGGDSRQPPWALTYAPASKTLMLSMHHALYDGDSSQMLLGVVARLYNDPSSTTALPLLPMSRGLELGLMPSAPQRDDATAAWSKHIHNLVEADGAVNAPFPDLTGSRQPQTRAILSAKATIPSDFLTHAVDRPDLPRLVQSAFGCVLAAVLELKTIVLGQTVSQRILHPDLAHVVGPAVATLPVAIRTQASSAHALWSEMGRDASLLGGHAHHLHPIDIKKMSNEGSGNPHAPFPALFVYHPAADNDDKTTGSNPASAFHEFGQALSLHVEHAMALNIFEGDRIMELTGDARRISQPMLDLMLAQILDQARAMLSHPDVPLSQLSNLMDRSLVSVIGEPQTLVGTKIATNPADLVAKQAAEHPDWVAIEEIALDDDDQISTTALTYHELEILVNTITAQIVALAAAKPGDVVAVYLDRNAASLAAIIAVFKLNFVYLPIDGDLPAARKQLLVRDANAKLVVSTQSLVGDLELTREAGAPVPFLLPEGSDDLDIIRSWASTNTDSVPIKADPTTDSAGGYLLYTSGSTGRPKGVRVTNESLLHYIAAMTQRLAEANPDVANLGGVGKFLNVASRAFDTHLTTMFSPWYLGFCSVIGKDRNGIFANLQHVINTVGITNMGTVPSVLLQLGLRLSDVPSIRVMTFGGEKASHELFDQLGGSDGGGDSSKAALMNFYGPTEAAVGCLSHTVGHHSNARNLGLPLPGLEALLLVSGSEDGQQVLARRGQPGELCIAGPQVAVGYLNRPDENARSFQSTTLLCADGTEKRMYRTGDIMRMMHDGTVEFLGRRDQQTKIRGQRFEIGEVEAYIKKVIADQGALDVAAAVVDQRLVGLLARKQAALLKAEREAPAELLSPPPGQACRDLLAMVEHACQKDLPAFMVPEMMWLSKMPFLAVSGKLDVKQISQLVRDADNAPGLDNQAASTSTVVALTAPEKQVLAALEEVLVGLKSSAVSSHSNIRGLGIDSLSGVHLLSVLKQRGFVNVSLADLLSPSASVNSLSQKFSASGKVSSRPRVPRVARVAPIEDSRQAQELSLSDLGPSAGHVDAANVSAVLPCLPLQSSLVALSLNWLHNEEEADVVPYVTRFNYQLASGVDATTWKLAAEQVVSSEAVLRTCFIQRDEDGQIFQVVLSSPPSPFATLDGDSDAINAVSLVSKMNSRPPIHLSVQDDGRVSLLIHHALYDGAAIASLRAKIEQTYLALTSGIPTPWSASDSITTLRRLANHCNLSGAEMQSVKSSWQDKLENVSPCRVDRSSSQSKQQFSSSHVTARSTRRLAYTAAELKSKLQLSVSLPSAFQLATVLVLANLTAGSPSIVYGYTTSLRSLLPHVADNMDGFIGPCLNTVVHALPLQDADETLHHLASRVDQNHADVSEGNMPLVTADQIQRWSGLDGKLFDSLLTINFVDEPSGEADVPNIMQPLPGNAKLDLALTIDIDLHQDGRIELLLASAGVLSESQLESAAGLFEKLVENAASSDATVGQFVSFCKAQPLGSIANGTATNSTRSASFSSRSSHTSVSTSSSDSELASVRSIVCQLLRLDESAVPADSSLYRLGLDSINVLPFVKLVNKAESVKITPNAVIRARTLQGVAALVHAAKSKTQQKTPKTTAKTTSAARGPAPPGYDKILQQVAGDLLFVATPLQEGMLSASMALADQAYTYTHTMQLSSAALQQDAPDFSLFFAAVQDTVLACEILRTRFIFIDNNHAPWVGVVSPTDQSDLVSWKVSASGVIQLRIHHALYDASSIQALWRILRKNYAARLSGVNDQRAQGPTHLYRHFAKQVALAQDSAVSFWVNTVQDFNYSPSDALLDGGSQKHASSSFHFALDTKDLSTLQTTCRNANVALKAAMQLAWAKVLCEALYLQADIVFGEVITTSSDDADDTVVMGPTINTIPMRLQLSGPNSLASIADALSKLQGLGDQARGPTGMASLRDVQTAWRSSRADGVDTSSGLFQSLFVFDGDISTPTTTSSDAQNPIVPVSDSAETNSSTGDKTPLYDDYPLIASFRIRDGVLHGALRAKLGETEVHGLGSQLQSSLLWISSSSLHETVLDSTAVSRFPVVATPTSVATLRKTDAANNTTASDAQLADSILDLAKQVVGSRIRGNVSHSTKLVNIGLDSISAIRFSNLLKKKMGIHVSVFDIIKGASVESIVQKLASSKQAQSTEKPQVVQNDHSLVEDLTLANTLAAAKLGLSTDRIKSVLPVLSGQRHTLQHWLHSGKRFFEAPWVYRVAEGKSIDAQTVAGIWAKLCQTHDILQTTFVSLDHANVPDLVQVTLHASDSTTARFIDVQDKTNTIQHLIETYVRDTNSTPSDLAAPPTRLSFLDAADGQAIVLRVHHALYDAWSIKMILRDLASLFAGTSLESRPSLDVSVQEIARFRTPMAEQTYWNQHLASGQDTIFQATSTSTSTAPLGPHFKASYPDILTVQAAADNKTQTSAAIIAAYAQALGQQTNTTHPTFGLNYSSRSLTSANDEQTLELTGMSLPTMTVVPMTVDLQGQQQSLDAVHEHLVELTKFAQADDLHELSARYNTHINILFSDRESGAVNSNGQDEVLQRHRLGEPLASEYFTKTVPLTNATSTVDGINVSSLPKEQLYFNVLVRNGAVNVDVSGDADLLSGDANLVANLVASFSSFLSELLK